jgi:ribosome-associated protein
MKIAGKRISGGGVLVIEARRFRTREQNRRDALRRFHRLINTAGEEPKLRRRTKPTQASRESRLLAKEKRSEVKKYRAKRSED